MGFFLKSSMKIGFILAMSILVSGCAGAMKGKSEPNKPKNREATAVYYDFDDILIPKELKVVDKATVVVSTPGYTSGIITLKGRVEKRSLHNFFTNNMLKDNWSIVSQIKSPVSTIMVFQKSSRWSVITIREQNMYTYVEAGVAPTLETIPSPSSGESEQDLFN